MGSLLRWDQVPSSRISARIPYKVMEGSGSKQLRSSARSSLEVVWYGDVFSCHDKIGRESFRGRVSSSVVDLSLKKTFSRDAREWS